MQPSAAHTESFRLGCFSFLVFISISISSFNCVASCIICGRTQSVDWDKAASRSSGRGIAASSLRFLHCCACNSSSVIQSVTQFVRRLLIHTASQSFIRSSMELDSQSVRQTCHKWVYFTARPATLFSLSLSLSLPQPSLVCCGACHMQQQKRRSHIKSNINKQTRRQCYTTKFVCSFKLSNILEIIQYTT